MDSLPKPTANLRIIEPHIHQVVRRVEQVTVILSKIAKEEGFDLSELAQIWATLPIDESGGVTYLEAASQCIIEVSSLVDKTFPAVSYSERIAKKFRLMSQLLSLKADQLS